LRKSKTLAKLRAGQSVRVCGLGHFIPSYASLAAHFGFDCIWLDAEHRTFNDREIQSLLAYCHQYDIDCMLRPATLEKTRLYRYLEDGAAGLMIPFVSTPEKARMLVDAVKFPPLGDRGLDGVGQDCGLIVRGDEFVDHANRETFLVAQIETPQAVENIDAIAAVEGVDVVFIGPADLGLRLRRTETPLTLDDAIDKVAAAAQRHGKAWGCTAPSPERVRQLRDRGARFIGYGGDYLALRDMLSRVSGELDEVYGKPSS